uniref:uncharacterized protein LOC124049819 isoform X3 n=1 Tax=Scatophagus argus TaxID=75038 RepID=UPI001ED7E95A|nr:uncharacterized protein LOC124049819 isoform X3 [Scatophagus argus]
MQAAAVSSEAMAEMDRTGLASTDGRSECTGGVTVSLDTRKKKGITRRRDFSRLLKLKRHHKICEDRYIRASEELKKKEREKNLSLLHIFASNKHHSSSDSENTVVLGPTEDADEDTTVPELTRTDSIVLTRQMLGYTEIIEEGYVPETESDSSAEEDGRGRLYKKKRSEKVAINSNASDTEDEDDSTMKMSQHPSQHPLTSRKRKWSEEEIQAVEKTLLGCITSGKVPRRKTVHGMHQGITITKSFVQMLLVGLMHHQVMHHLVMITW